MKHDHDMLRRAMEIWQQHKHTAQTDVTLRQFIGVFNAVMAAAKERAPAVQSGAALAVSKSDLQRLLEMHGHRFSGQDDLSSHEVNPCKPCRCGRATFFGLAQ